MNARTRFKSAKMVLLAAALLALAATALRASGLPPEMIRAYDMTQWEMAEGIAVDKVGNIFVSHQFLGQLRKIGPNGSESLYASLGPGLLGLAVDAPGNVYVARFDPACPLPMDFACYIWPQASPQPGGQRGVYRVTRDGEVERLAGTEEMWFPNSLVFDATGNLYVTDSWLGAIWRIPRGGTAELWLQHETLEGVGGIPWYPPIGANGIAYRQGQLYVANSEKGLILRVPIAVDGSAGEPQVLAEAFGGSPDGITLDVHGAIYAVVATPEMTNQLVRINPLEGGIETLATAAEGLDWPTSLAFGTGKGDRQSVYLTNYPQFWLFGYTEGTGSAVVRIDVGVPGLPLP